MSKNSVEWESIDVDSMPENLAEAYNALREAQDAARQAREAFEADAAKAIRKALKVPASKDVKFAYRFGLAYAITDKAAPKAAKKKGFSF